MTNTGTSTSAAAADARMLALAASHVDLDAIVEHVIGHAEAVRDHLAPAPTLEDRAAHVGRRHIPAPTPTPRTRCLRVSEWVGGRQTGRS